MNLAIEWEHRLQLLGGAMHPESFRTLAAAHNQEKSIRDGGGRVVAILSTPKQIVTTCLGGDC